MASKAKMIVNSDPTQPETTVEEREGLPHSTREQEIRNRAYEIYLQRGEQPGYELEDWLQAERELEPQARSTNAGDLGSSRVPRR